MQMQMVSLCDINCVKSVYVIYYAYVYSQALSVYGTMQHAHVQLQHRGDAVVQTGQIYSTVTAYACICMRLLQDPQHRAACTARHVAQ